MSSLVHYRFKAGGSSDWSRIQFDGHAITVGELKKAITIAKKLAPNIDDTSTGKMLQDFELVLTDLYGNTPPTRHTTKQTRIGMTVCRAASISDALVPGCASG